MKSSWTMANAGSGKTTRLTHRVVTLLLQGVEPERIVCITYTKAAANEMRTRILDAVRALLLADDVVCRSLIEKITQAPATEALLGHARSLFATLLDSPTGGIQITTIHGFCQSMLQRFPLEAGIAPHFTVVEETMADDLQRHAKHAVLEATSTDESLAWAIDIIGARGGEFRFDTLAEDILKTRRVWQRVWHLQSPESLREQIYAFNDVTLSDSHEALAEWFCGTITEKDVETLKSYVPEMLAHAQKGWQAIGAKLAAIFERGHNNPHADLEIWLDVLLTQEGTARTVFSGKAYAEGHPLRETLLGLAHNALRYVVRTSSLACAEESWAAAIFAKVLLAQYSAIKAAHHALDYDDLIERTIHLCSDPKTMGWVMSKLDHRIDHLLIDEAQDNSADVWRLAYILVEELMANTGEMNSTKLPRSVLVVGDEKQSIYSFQGAAPEQFEHYRHKFKELLTQHGITLTEDVLEKSYRSTPAVLSLVDAVCAQTEVMQALSAKATQVQHLKTRETPIDVGQVILYPLLIQPDKESVEAMVMPLEYRQSINYAQQRAEQIASVITHWLQVEKRPLISKGRPLRAGDILILVNRRAPLVQPLIRALQRHKIAVAGIDRLMLSDHLAVSDLLALMQWCGNTADDLALAQVLRSPLVGISDEELCAVAYGRTDSLWRAISNEWLVQVLHWREWTPYDFLTQVLEVSGKRREFVRRFGAEVHEVLDELKAQAAAMPPTLANSLTEFHAWISGSQREIKREQENSDIDQVRIMTVHGAKGLEAPVVILADTVNVPNTSKERIFSARTIDNLELPVLSFSGKKPSPARYEAARDDKKHKLLSEYQRLLYVALTRARDELHVFGAATKKGAIKDSSWYETVEKALRTANAQEVDGCLILRDEQSTADVPAMPEAIKTAEQTLPNWIATPPLQQEVTAFSLAPSRGDVAITKPYAATPPSLKARERGVRIHRVLELLNDQSDASLIAQLVDYVAPDWSSQDQAEISEAISKLHEQERWLWSNPHWAEVNVAGNIEHEGGLIPVNGQIDMLVQTPEAMVILDYKTGIHVPQSAADVAEGYVLQLKIYHALVRQIYPNLPVRCAILWTHNAQLMWLDAQVTAAAFPSREQLIKNSLAA